ncbi:MAG: hypothetical protein NTX25_03390, partial [Proteobacteria bacterium]|nr:hypothetical protein [Pseudomonadota bacterium]
MAPKALSKKILSLILIASTIITTVLTCATLYIDYRSELNSLERSLDQLERMTINPLSLAIWSFDEPQIHIFMQGIVAISDFAEVSITDSSGTLMYHLKRESQKETNSWWQGIVTDYLESHSYPLKIKLKGEPQKLIGSLHVLVSKQRILNNLAKKLEVIFVAEAIKTILISLTILTIVHIYVTRHIFRIVQYLESYRRKNFKPDGPLKLIHHTGKADEIQSLATSLNALITELDKQFVSNSKRLVSTEQELEHQRMLSTQLARLASLGEMAGGIAHEINNP